MVFVAGHFGEWLQGRIGQDGPLGLITVSCPEFGVRATPLSGTLDIDGGRALSQDLLDRLLAEMRVAPSRGLSLRGDFSAGCGTGMSTASLLAVAQACGYAGDPAALCLRVEGATDPLMFDRPDAVLWASREARVLAEVPPPPVCEIVGGFWGRPLRTDPTDLNFPDVSDLWVDWQGARELGDYAEIASESAIRCTAMRGPDNDPMDGLARDLGALGHIRAHTGSARGLVFEKGRVPEGAQAALTEAGLKRPVRFVTGGG